MSPIHFHSRRYDLAVNTIARADLEELIGWLRGYPRLTMSDETVRFENAWSKWLGVRHSVMCNSGASANLLMYAALDAAGLAGSRKVVVPATGWPTDISPGIQFGWKPIMCESDRRTFGLDPDCLEKIVKRERPAAVVVVHVLGVPADMTSIVALKKKYGFALLEDACAAHGACHRGKKVGTFGDISVFSFYYGHHMSTVEGGVVCTGSQRLHHALLMLRSHGWLKDLPRREAARIMRRNGFDPFHAPFLFRIPGFNLRPTEISAHLGLIQLRNLDKTIAIRVRNHLIYQRLLRGVVEYAPGLPGDKVSSISFCAVARSSSERKKIVKVLEQNKIDTRIFTAGNLGRHPFWHDRYCRFSAPVADRLYEGGFFLPNNQSLDDEDISYVCGLVRRYAGDA